MFNLIESTNLSELCDYSFGDQASIVHNLFCASMKPANLNNNEFLKLYNNKKEKGVKIMTLFIDNIRLYKRDIKYLKPSDNTWVNSLMDENDLLKLCSVLSDMSFIIFTGHEDTPIDEYIFNKIPENVLSIVAVNAESFGGKVIPLPYGLQRKLTPNDNRLEIIQDMLEYDVIPNKLLYVNHSVNTNSNERNGINELYFGKNWVNVDYNRVDYRTFLTKIKEHKFMICPIGNAIDCHRNWEVLYMRRVPVMKRNNYLEFLFKDFPVLFVDSYKEISDLLLLENNHLFEESMNMDLECLDLDKIFKKFTNLEINHI
jgi:hypothetical protein